MMPRLIVGVMAALHVHRLVLEQPRLLRVVGLIVLPVELLLAMPQRSAMPLLPLMLLMVRVREIGLVRVLLQIHPLLKR